MKRFVLKMGMAPTENRAHKAGIEVAGRSTTVYIVGVAFTNYGTVQL